MADQLLAAKDIHKFCPQGTHPYNSTVHGPAGRSADPDDLQKGAWLTEGAQYNEKFWHNQFNSLALCVTHVLKTILQSGVAPWVAGVYHPAGSLVLYNAIVWRVKQNLTTDAQQQTPPAEGDDYEKSNVVPGLDVSSEKVKIAPALAETLTEWIANLNTDDMETVSASPITLSAKLNQIDAILHNEPFITGKTAETIIPDIDFDSMDLGNPVVLDAFGPDWYNQSGIYSGLFESLVVGEPVSFCVFRVVIVPDNNSRTIWLTRYKMHENFNPYQLSSEISRLVFPDRVNDPINACNFTFHKVSNSDFLYFSDELKSDGNPKTITDKIEEITPGPGNEVNSDHVLMKPDDTQTLTEYASEIDARTGANIPFDSGPVSLPIKQVHDTDIARLQQEIDDIPTTPPSRYSSTFAYEQGDMTSQTVTTAGITQKIQTLAKVDNTNSPINPNSDSGNLDKWKILGKIPVVNLPNGLPFSDEFIQAPDGVGSEDYLFDFTANGSFAPFVDHTLMTRLHNNNQVDKVELDFELYYQTKEAIKIRTDRRKIIINPVRTSLSGAALAGAVIMPGVMDVHSPGTGFHNTANTDYLLHSIIFNNAGMYWKFRINNHRDIEMNYLFNITLYRIDFIGVN